MTDINMQYTAAIPPSIPVWSRDLTALNQVKPSIIVPDTEPGSDHQPRYCVMPKWVAYHLMTGANWKGGIRSFQLIIKNETGTPFAVNEFYRADSKVNKNITDKIMTFKIDNFIPEKNLMILFLSLPQTAEERKICGM